MLQRRKHWSHFRFFTLVKKTHKKPTLHGVTWVRFVLSVCFDKICDAYRVTRDDQFFVRRDDDDFNW